MIRLSSLRVALPSPSWNNGREPLGVSSFAEEIWEAEGPLEVENSWEADRSIARCGYVILNTAILCLFSFPCRLKNFHNELS